ncbi:LL-diaminopimelate aminotransferase [Paenibacillus cellulosilyticus]|uniref:Aminotransferase n=1 Tax=Paenibacillus cellulosilyticus TaxID=375489 RepID=A0A2V2YZ48_9BACL|nr:aminotransferase class I/II-fold pyridoxal phosphate-dependent enzyme [Paenibacillus cellulosilyticus]PWW07400.1 LL-diaminopimelate aminotransferase [Paenibacillus cellulosilyticus]QKS44434.1 aminotransferase class I/II-fold pyridoxal phosphate-dependent enzyme [Paenibacillus cellulosilyticus]
MANRSWRSSKLERLGSSIFAEVASWKEEASRAGRQVIDLGIGSPDRPPTEAVRKALSEAVLKSDRYAYPSSQGSLAFRQQAAKWMDWRFGVTVDPKDEIVTLMGSQDGLAHLALALCDAGDQVVVPDPGYPIYSASLALAGVEPVLLPLRAENGFLPDLAAVPQSVWENVKFVLLGYPANPVTSIAEVSFFEQMVALAKQHGFLLVHDLAYSEMGFDGVKPISVLQIPGAKDVAVEFHSLSKSFNMAGCRIGFLVGNSTAVGALRELKANIDYGVFGAVQEAGIVALEEGMSGAMEPVGRLYERRRDLFIEALAAEGWRIEKPKATMFVWAPLPKMAWTLEDGNAWNARRISREMLIRVGVAVIPGDAFGSEGEGFVRIALVEDESKLLEAARRIGAFIRGEQI